jgi:hypothetical protein
MKNPTSKILAAISLLTVLCFTACTDESNRNSGNTREEKNYNNGSTGNDSSHDQHHDTKDTSQHDHNYNK